VTRTALALALAAIASAGAAAAGTAPAPGISLERVTDLELQWLEELDTNGRPTLALGAAAARLESRLAASVRSSRASVVSIRIYRTRGSLAPDVRIRAVDTAAFLRNRLETTLRLLRAYPYVYVRVSDARGLALDWYTRPDGGALTLRRDIADCSPIEPMGRLSPAQPGCPAR
jgi:hypothetical protein